MVTDSAQHHSNPAAPGILVRTGEQLRRFICGLHGHDSLLHFEKGRLSLLCTSCGHQTPGWDVRTEPVQHQAVQQKPRRVLRMPLVSQRRIA
jgi:hypothetical protein